MADPEIVKEHLRRYRLLGFARCLKAPGTILRRNLNRRRGYAWSKGRSEAVSELVYRDMELWAEAEKMDVALKERASSVLKGLDHLQLGGGGECRLLYFLARLKDAVTIVETGVAAGWSTTALLWALELNGQEEGQLWSSELPYDRSEMVTDYRPYIGLLVDEKSKRRWHLLLDGDDRNVPKILDNTSGIDLFHYDSRKTARARDRTLDMILPHMNMGGVIVVDDVDDNLQFRKWVAHHCLPYRVIESDGKFVGVVELH